MPVSCSAYNCTNRYSKTSNISFYKFPLKDPDLTIQWVHAVRRDNWKPSKSSHLCSEHFENKYIYETNSTKRLLAKAIPTIFSFPEHLQKKSVSRPSTKKRICLEFSKVEPEIIQTDMQNNADCNIKMDNTENEHDSIDRKYYAEKSEVFEITIKEEWQNTEENKQEFQAAQNLNAVKNFGNLDNSICTIDIKEEPVVYTDEISTEPYSQLYYSSNESNVEEKADILCEKSCSVDQLNSVSEHRQNKSEKHVRKGSYQSWSQDNMISAMKEVISGRMGYSKASKSFGVPYSTLERRLKRVKNGLTAEDASKKGLGHYKPVFTPEQEKQLVDYILSKKNGSSSLTQLELRQLAYEMAEKKNLKHNFNPVKKTAGTGWFYSFLQRHPEVKMQTLKSTSTSQMTRLNKTSVNEFFTHLSSLFQTYNFKPDRIYNVDKLLVRTSSESDILILREKQVQDLVSAKNGVLVTAVTCINAIGNFMPTMFVFPCQTDDPSLLEDAPPGSTAEFHPSGLMQKDIFMKWFQNFLEFSRPSAEKPLLLLLDGHASCTKSIELMNEARKNNVILLWFPPDCTNHMQPFEVDFMVAVSQYYSQEIIKWLLTHPGQAVTVGQIGKLYGTAFMKAASVKAAVNGFRRTGIYPLNPSIFPDWMFKSSKSNVVPPDS